MQVIDVNDNAPRFDNTIYNVTDVVEEELGISKNNHKYLLAVSLIMGIVLLMISFEWMSSDNIIWVYVCLMSDAFVCELLAVDMF